MDASMAPRPLGPPDASHVLPDIIQRLRHYRVPSSPAAAAGATVAADGCGVHEQGTVFSSVGLAAPAAAPLPERFSPRRAAVLICLFDGGGGDLRVILTKRASTLSTHSGEVAFPGGKRDEGDVDDVATALREAEEEIGLDPSLVTVITCLEPFLSKAYKDTGLDTDYCWSLKYFVEDIIKKGQLKQYIKKEVQAPMRQANIRELEDHDDAN